MKPRYPTKRVLWAALLLAACGGGPSSLEIEQPLLAPDPAPQPTDADLRLMTYNILHGALGLQAIAAQIRAQQPDVIHLQEVDVHARRSGVVDQPAELARLTGLTHYAFDPVLDFEDGGQYGTAFLSRYPFDVVLSHLLPPSHHDRRLFVIDVTGPSGQVHRIGGTHLSFDPQYQDKQVTSLLDACRRASVGAILGDLNITPYNSLYARFLRDYDDAWTKAQSRSPARGLTFPATAPTVRIDYVFVKNRTVLKAQVPDTRASDHRPVVAHTRP